MTVANALIDAPIEQLERDERARPTHVWPEEGQYGLRVCLRVTHVSIAMRSAMKLPDCKRTTAESASVMAMR
jgi:hypothetical protein